MGRMTCRPTCAMQDPDFIEGKEFGSVKDCWQEDDPSEGEESSYRWIQIVQGCGAWPNYDGEERLLHYARFHSSRTRLR